MSVFDKRVFCVMFGLGIGALCCVLIVVIPSVIHFRLGQTFYRGVGKAYGKDLSIDGSGPLYILKNGDELYIHKGQLIRTIWGTQRRNFGVRDEDVKRRHPEVRDNRLWERPVETLPQQ